MSHKIKSIVGIMAIGLVAFASCKKKSDDSAKAKLTGKWKTTKVATDVNSNGSMDATEVFTLPDSVSSYVTFNADGSGSSQGVATGSTSVSLTWKLINSDKDIVITEGGSSDTAHIESLNSTDLEISDNSDNGMGGTTKGWVFLHKQ